LEGLAFGLFLIALGESRLGGPQVILHTAAVDVLVGRHRPHRALKRLRRSSLGSGGGRRRARLRAIAFERIVFRGRAVLCPQSAGEPGTACRQAAEDHQAKNLGGGGSLLRAEARSVLVVSMSRHD
jgi:hypothetical protein